MTSNSRAKEKRREQIKYQEQGFQYATEAMAQAYRTLLDALVDLRIIDAKEPAIATTFAIDVLEHKLEGIALCNLLLKSVRPGLSMTYANDFFTDYQEALMNMFSEEDRQKLAEYRKILGPIEVSVEVESAAEKGDESET